MKIYRTISLFLLLFVSSITFLFHEHDTYAQEDSLQGSIFLYSGRLDVGNESFVELLDSVVLYLSVIDSLDFVAFVNGANSNDFIGPHQNSHEALVEFHKIISESFTENARLDSNGLFNSLNSLNSIYPTLSDIKGSKIYLLDSNSSYTEEDLSQIYKSEIYTNLLANQIEINFINLGVNNNDSEVVDVITKDSGGKYFHLKDADSISNFFQSIYSESSFTFKQNVLDKNLTSDQVMTTEFHILPQTSNFLVAILNNAVSETAILIKDPLGKKFIISPGQSNKNIDFLLTDKVKLLNFKNPKSGIWNLEVSGINGYLSILEKFEHKYSLILNSNDVIQLNQPSLIVGTIFNDEIQVVTPSDFSDTKIFLTILTPDNVDIVVEMLDDGLGRDESKFDGKYTALLPPFSSSGEYRLLGEIKFAGLNNVIKSQKTVKVTAFPKIDFNKIPLPRNFELNNKYKIADVYINVLGEPYPISEKLLSVEISSDLNVDQNQLDIIPKPVYHGGPAWEYEVFFTPKDFGIITLSLNIDMIYSGVSMLFTSAALILEFPEPIKIKNDSESGNNVKNNTLQKTPISSKVDQISNTNVSDSKDILETENIDGQISQINIILYTLIGIILLFILYVLSMNRLRSPFGYLLDSNDSPLVDFRYIRRGLFNKIFFKNVVYGKDLSIFEIEDIVFKFSTKGVLISSSSQNSQIRVNNQPIIGEILILENSWIGIGGHLYSFKFNL